MASTEKRRYVLMPKEAVEVAAEASVSERVREPLEVVPTHAAVHAARRAWNARPILMFSLGIAILLTIGGTLSWAIARGRSISLMGLQINGTTEAEVRALRDELASALVREKQLLATLDERVRRSVPIDDFDPSLRKNTPVETAAQVNGLLKTTRTLVSNVPAAMQLIESHLSENGNVLNTQRSATSAERMALYQAVQVCLNAAGGSGLEPDGDQRTTCDAVRAFQRGIGVVADGKIGKNTWPRLKLMLTESIAVNGQER